MSWGSVDGDSDRSARPPDIQSWRREPKGRSVLGQRPGPGRTHGVGNDPFPPRNPSGRRAPPSEAFQRPAEPTTPVAVVAPLQTARLSQTCSNGGLQLITKSEPRRCWPGGDPGRPSGPRTKFVKPQSTAWSTSGK